LRLPASGAFTIATAPTGKTETCSAQKNGRYLDRKTDFRSVFGEIFSDHFGNTPKQLDDVIPTYAQAKKENPSDFKKLGFIS